MTEQLAIGIVEDSDQDFYVFHRIASKSGTIRRWTSAEQALESFESESVLRDLAILFVDCHLPGIDGIDLVKEVRAKDHGDTLKIVMVSGSQNAGVSARAVRAGVDRFERKGNGLRDLRDALQRSFALLETAT